jgi:cytochrome c556
MMTNLPSFVDSGQANSESIQQALYCAPVDLFLIHRSKKMTRIVCITAALALLSSLPCAQASESVQEQRHELMESSKTAAKTIGGMLKGEQEFNAAMAMESFGTWDHIAGTFGDLFPEGSETGHDTEAKESIWTDRDGFNAELAAFSEAVTAAIEADPQDLEALKTAAGPVFKACKSCHEGYRVEEEG